MISELIIYDLIAQHERCCQQISPPRGSRTEQTKEQMISELIIHDLIAQHVGVVRNPLCYVYPEQNKLNSK